MSHDMIKRIKFDQPIICSKCSNPTKPGDFVKCHNCTTRIHKFCYNLNGDLLRVYEEYEENNEEFPFYSLCTECRDFLKVKNIRNTLYDFLRAFSGASTSATATRAEQQPLKKNPLEIDNIIEQILENMNIEDLKKARLVSKTWNKNATLFLSKQSIQDRLKPNLISNIFMIRIEDFNKILRNSPIKKIFRKFQFLMCLDPPIENEEPTNQDHIFEIMFDIIDLTNPTDINFQIISRQGRSLKMYLFSNFLNKISSHIVHLTININIGVPICFSNFQEPEEFSKLETLKFEYVQKGYNVIRLIEKCPKLKNLHLNKIGVNNEGHYIDDYITLNDMCVLPQMIIKNLETLSIGPTNLRCLKDLKNIGMKLKTLSIGLNFTRFDTESVFQHANSFLTSVKETLEKFTLYFTMNPFNLPIININPNNLTLDIPRLVHVQYFELKFGESNKKFRIPDEIWPMKEIKLPQIFPNLKKIFITYMPDWLMSFNTEMTCESVKELVLEKWIDGDFTKIVKLFPKVEYLKLENFSYHENDKLYTKICNIDGWANTLKRIEIGFLYYHLENFSFDVFLCLPKLESISLIHQTAKGKYFDFGTEPFIYPEFAPLEKLPNLSKLTINDFKISKGIIEDCHKKFEKLDFTLRNPVII